MGVVGSPLWSPEEDNRLRELAWSGKSVATIAKQLKRSGAAVRGRALKLNVPVTRLRKFGLRVKARG